MITLPIALRTRSYYCRYADHLDANNIIEYTISPWDFGRSLSGQFLPHIQVFYHAPSLSGWVKYTWHLSTGGTYFQINGNKL